MLFLGPNPHNYFSKRNKHQLLSQNQLNMVGS